MARTKAAARGRRGRSKKGSIEEPLADDQDAVATADELDGDSDFDGEGDGAAGAETEAEAPLAEDAIDDDDLDEGSFDGDDDGEDLSAAEKLLGNKQGNARELAIRRAIEERREARRLKEDLDYLDLDD